MAKFFFFFPPLDLFYFIAFDSYPSSVTSPCRRSVSGYFCLNKLVADKEEEEDSQVSGSQAVGLWFEL